MILAATLAAILPSVAQAQWVPIGQRQANLASRIEQGVRNGALTRPEAVRLRQQYRDITRLENRYRATGGLSAAERRDLDRRFDRLSRRVYVQKRDRQVR
ncbi:MAG: hypothetical protein K2X76_16465 [Sphingomonas sp.]|nr:hypothetical protein [Sphingomonas sp.]